MRRIIAYKIENEEKAQKLFIKAIKEYQAHNKREYIEKNLKANSKYPSVTYFRENVSLNFDICRELAGVEHINPHKVWSEEKLYKLIHDFIKIRGFKEVSYSFIREETGIYLNSTILRYFGGINKLKELIRKNHPELDTGAY